MRWSNVPVPEPHLAGIAVGAGLHLLLPLRLPVSDGFARAIAAPLVAGGAGLVFWAVRSAAEADVERDTSLVTNGAFALTRNPMYLGWSTGMLGLALASRSAWLLLTWGLAVTALGREIDREEARLRARFGAAYAAYRTAVPRYLWAGKHHGRRRASSP
jgi:protein-S-isoprenylcysteine O-methyltransferase Ste14